MDLAVMACKERLCGAIRTGSTTSDELQSPAITATLLWHLDCCAVHPLVLLLQLVRHTSTADLLSDILLVCRADWPPQS
jgi:hypothetical protein